MSRRDHQRDRVYSAEDVTLELLQPQVLTLRQAQYFINKVIAGEVFNSVSKNSDGVVIQETTELWSWADKSSKFIVLNPDHMTRMVILHELAHIAMIRARSRRMRMQDHGPEFVYLIDKLYRTYLPAEEYYEWRAAALLNRVQGIFEAMAPTK